MFKLYDYQQDLVDRTRKSLANGSKGVFVVAPPGAGKSIVIAEIARLTVKKGGHVLFFVHRNELIEQIKESFIQQDVDLYHTTIMTVGKVANRLGKLKKPTLIICDESHHAKAATYRKVYDYYSDVPRLGFSATPWRMNGKGFEDIYDDMIEGPSVQWLIANNKLAPYQYYSVRTFDNNKLKKSSTGDYTNSSITDAIKPTLYGDIVKTWLSKAKGKRTIVYAHDIKHSQKIAEAFKQAGIKAKHADSKTPKKERNKIMNQFRTGEITVLCNVSLVDEGFSVNECECCIIARPTNSLVFNTQASMRCMRYVPGKTGIIIDHAANYTRFGLPDTDREWTLGDRKRKKKGQKKDAPPIKQCPFCYGVISAQFKTCPLCGKEIPVEEQEIQEDKNSELEVIQKDFKFSTEYIGLKKPKDLKTYSELKEYARIKGYKAGWIYFQAKAKHLI